MGEVSQDSGHKKKGQSKKMSTKIDFTPMVDLGFLLITFFMLTTTMSQPKTMEINMPLKEDVPDDEKTKFKASQTLITILGKEDKVYYYFQPQDPETEPTIEVTDYSAGGIRKKLLEESRSRNPIVDSIGTYRKQFQNRSIDEETLKKHIRRIKDTKEGLIVVIKAMDESKYKNLVDILDEMAICNIGRYAIVDITDQDKGLIQKQYPGK